MNLFKNDHNVFHRDGIVPRNINKIDMNIIIACYTIFILTSYFSYSQSSSSSKILFENSIVDGYDIRSKNNNDCLENYYGKPEGLLTQDLVGKYVDFEAAEVEVAKVSEQIIRDKDRAQVNCEWKIDRKRYIIRLKAIHKIKLYDKTPVEQFYFQYHTRTKEEQAELKKDLDKEVEKTTTDRNAKNVTDSVGMNFAYLRIDHVGDAAVWEHKVNDLIVLVGNYQFTLNVDLNKGNDNDLEKAKLLAQAIIDKSCD